jgi:hypothetical protein
MLCQHGAEGGSHAVIRPERSHAPVTTHSISIATLQGGSGVAASCWDCRVCLVLRVEHVWQSSSAGPHHGMLGHYADNTASEYVAADHLLNLLRMR